jgi:hypothetical protein
MLEKVRIKMEWSHRHLLALAIIVLIAGVGIHFAIASHAATPYASSIAETGTLTTGASRQANSQSADGTDVLFGSNSPSQNLMQPLLGALASSSSSADLYAAGFREQVVATNWSTIEPSEGSFSAAALANLQDQINSIREAGLSPSLDIGVQYAPSWIFTVGGGTQFIDQFGDVFSGSSTSGNYVPNAVTDMAVRTQLGSYINYLGTHLTGVDSVRLGGEAYNEMRYPSGTAGSQSNAYWFYDSSSQASLPANLQGWKPGSGSVAQATQFLNAYNNAMVGYGVWLEQTAGSAFPASTKLEMLLPGWGERPSEIGPAEADLLSGTPDEINQGLDWSDLLPELTANGRVVAYSTYADATQGGGSNPDPAAFLHSILPNGMEEGGESTGNGQTTTEGMNQMFQDATSWNWYAVNWFFNGQSQSLQTVDAAFGAN